VTISFCRRTAPCLLWHVFHTKCR